MTDPTQAIAELRKSMAKAESANVGYWMAVQSRGVGNCDKERDKAVLIDRTLGVIARIHLPELLDLLESLLAEKQDDGWMSADEPPRPDTEVLGLMPDGKMRVVVFANGIAYSSPGQWTSQIIRWRPLPKSPETK